MFIGISGGYLVAEFSGVVTTDAFIEGVQLDFKMFSIYYALIKTAVFAFIITSIPAYYGYNVKGGALEVGVASTKGVVTSSIVILIANYVITQLLLI
jgi:phospholipid/cholesterol/gamma-HCH transport system permease protein